MKGVLAEMPYGLQAPASGREVRKHCLPPPLTLVPVFRPLPRLFEKRRFPPPHARPLLGREKRSASEDHFAAGRSQDGRIYLGGTMSR